MTRWTGSWLTGSDEGGQRDGYPGERLGLPEEGVGSVAGLGRRAVAFVFDLLLSALVAGLFTAPVLPGNWSLLAWAVLTVVPTAAFGMTPGMVLFGLRVARLGGAAFVGLPRALLRTVLLFFVVPAVVTNSDKRGLHDRAVGTVVLLSR
ncbi:RDD family protein [Pseudonocardia acaciae]|uniref:RDD family protein n=1 Tax=Pseudonocardia acaciae TaxID=551276 RepID=UPI00048F804F|nr:RDD family protein [Pseudonocardia acaciae]